MSMSTEQSTEPVLPVTAEELAAELERLRQEHIAFRGTVRSVAMKYAKQHNLCTVVEAALREAGLEDQRIRVSVTTMVPTTLTLDLPVDLVGDKPDDVLVRDILAYVKNPRSSRAWSGVRVIGNTTGDPQDMVIERNVAPAAGNINGYVLRFGGYDGRKTHYVLESDLIAAQEGDRYRTAVSLCGRVAHRHDRWFVDSQNRRSEGMCQFCVDAAARRGLV